MKKLVVLLFLFIVCISYSNAAIYVMDGKYIKSLISTGYFSYNSKQVPSKNTHRYEGPRITCKEFPYLHLQGSDNMGGYGFLYETLSSAYFLITGTGNLTLNTTKGYISHIEIEHNSNAPLIDGGQGSKVSSGNSWISSKDGHWTNIVIKNSNSNSSTAIYSISVTIGDISKDGLIYEFDFVKESFNVKRCYNNTSSLSILSSLDYDGSTYPVEGILNNAFEGCNNLESVYLPNNIIRIGDSSFKDCLKLSTITLPCSLNSIGQSAFRNCSSLEHLNFPASVQSIGSDAFFNCSNLASLNIEAITSFCSVKFSNKYSNPLSYNAKLYIDNLELRDLSFDSTVNAINPYAFAGCSSIEHLFLSENINSIGSSAFIDCNNLSSVTNYSLNPIDVSDNVFGDVTYSGELLVPKQSMLKYKSTNSWNKFHKIAAIEGPDCDFEVDGIYYKIIDIANRTCKVTYDNPYYNSYFQASISIPETVEYNGRTFTVSAIDDNAFNGSPNLINLELPKTITAIGKDAFNNCTKLCHLVLPNSINKMEADMTDIRLSEVLLFGSGEIIPDWFKCNESLSKISFDCPNAKTVTNEAFKGCCSLSEIELPHSITSIGEKAFEGCNSIENIILPTSLSELGNGAFKDCNSLISIDFNSQLTHIPESAFFNCIHLSEINWRDKIQSIGTNAFNGCSSLEMLDIPAQIISIESNAFLNCTGISKIVIEDSKDSLCLGTNSNNDGIFSSCPITELFIGRDLDGINPFNRNMLIETIVFGHQVTKFPDNNLCNQPSLKSLIIGNSLSAIPSFNNCAKLEYLELGSKLEFIPSFKDCTSLRTIKLHSAKPQNVESEFANKVYIDCNLLIPKGTNDRYSNAPVWKNFFNNSEYNSSSKASSISFTKEQYDIYPEESIQLPTILTPLDANQVFIWQSSNEDVASVDIYGLVSAKNSGESTITVSTTDGSNISASCIVKVNQVQQISNLIFIEDYYALTVGEQVSLDIKIEPSDATYKNLLWSSSDETIATVSNGTVISHSVGKVTITAESTDGSNVVAYCIVEVLPIYITNIDIISTSKSIVQKDKMQLDVVITPDNASFKSLNWEVSDTTIATINDNGLLEAVLPGKCTVYAYTTDGSNLFASQEFEVLPIVASTITADINQTLGLIDLKWNALEYVKDVKDFNVYVSENDSDFVLWLHNTTQTTAQFKGKEGGNYRFLVTMRNKNNDTEKYDESKCIYINNISK